MMLSRNSGLSSPTAPLSLPSLKSHHGQLACSSSCMGLVRTLMLLTFLIRWTCQRHSSHSASYEKRPNLWRGRLKPQANVSLSWPLPGCSPCPRLDNVTVSVRDFFFFFFFEPFFNAPIFCSNSWSPWMHLLHPSVFTSLVFLLFLTCKWSFYWLFVMVERLTFLFVVTDTPVRVADKDRHTCPFPSCPL